MDEEYIFEDNYYDDNDENGIGLERDAYDRMNQVEVVDMKNPKDKFYYLINQNYDNFGITKSQLEKIKNVVSDFRELQFENYNVDGILAGYAMYRSKPKNKKEFDAKYDELKPHINASKFDIARYMKLWTNHLSKSSD